MIKTDNIKNKLKLLGYRLKETQYADGEVVLIVYLPILCYLKIRLMESKIKISLRTYMGLGFFSLEFNYAIYSLALALLLAFEIIQVNSVLTIFFFLFILYFLLCIIKLEFLKLNVYRWIEEELDIK